MQKGKYDVAETMLLQALSLFEELDHEIYGAGVAAATIIWEMYTGSRIIWTRPWPIMAAALAVGLRACPL